MTPLGSDRFLVVDGGDDERLARAVGRHRDLATAADSTAAVTVVVGDSARAAEVRRLVADRGLAGRVSVDAVVSDDPAGLVADRVETGDVSGVVVDPARVDRASFPDLPVPVEWLPAPRPTRRRRLRHGRDRLGVLVTFVLSSSFYLLLGDPTDPFDLVTGAATAALVAAALASVAVETGSSAATAVARTARATLFLPYLLFEIARANVRIASVILRPSLPIDPETVEFDPSADGPFERAVLANAITLTPGTVTVDATAECFRVHTLTAGTRAGLRDGGMARAVAWVFHGRDGR
ncbi:Na+/H+ antiporter subunit E [Halosimplex amylolyticum]|uniref:Na+/H+ antiporter subunit E n=1 Tax=Halosimplex amylolyticum TaxID=3396616 RepID=UPI003F5664F3